MARAIISVVALAAAGALAGCGSTGGGGAAGGATAPVSKGPVTIVKGRTPVQLYSHIARQVRACWLSPQNPVLPKHVFRARAGAGGASGVVTKIEIHRQTRDLKRGLKAFTIDFQPRRNGTQIIARNLKLPYDMGQKLVSDVGYWAQGGANCAGPVSNPVSRRKVEGPRVSQ